MNNSRILREKVNLIKTEFPESLKCNPYDSKDLLSKIKLRFFEMGFYAHKEMLYNAAADEAVIKLIRRAQGEVVTNRPGKASRRSV